MHSQLLEARTLPLDAIGPVAESGRLYALLDACDSPAVPPKMWGMGEETAVSLYRGSAEEDYWSFAPYLARCDAGTLDWIVKTLWSEPWGLFVVADQPIEALRKHFRRFLIVDDPDGEEMYFRFYDPRVMRKFLPTCSGKELNVLFDDIRSFIIADESGTDANLEIRRVPGAWSPTPAWFGIGQRLQIGQEQMDAFGPEAERSFEAKLVKHLRKEHAAVTRSLPDELLLDMARGGVARARSYGIAWESNLMAYVGLMFEMAPNFDEHPRIRGVMASANVDPETKLDLIVKRTPKRVWREIEQQYDAAAWSRPAEANA